MATVERYNEVEAFKEQVLTDFLKKHRINPKDVADGKNSPDGYILQVSEPHSIFPSDSEEYILSLYKLEDRQIHTIKRTLVITYKTAPTKPKGKSK